MQAFLPEFSCTLEMPEEGVKDVEAEVGASFERDYAKAELVPKVAPRREGLEASNRVEVTCQPAASDGCEPVIQRLRRACPPYTYPLCALTWGGGRVLPAYMYSTRQTELTVVAKCLLLTIVNVKGTVLV